MATTRQKLLLATPTLIVAESAAAMAHGGGIGAIVAFGAAGLAYAYADEISAMFQRGDTPAGPDQRAVPDRQALKDFGYRLLNGKSVRAEREGAPPDDDFALAPAREARFTFSDLLATGWRPSYQQIFLARLEDGTNVFISVEQAVHIALAGSTRQGKTSIIRQLLAQLCYIGCCCVLLDPHYTPYDVEIDEDWTPYTPYLRFDPLECKSYDRIEQIMRHAATTLLDQRKARREQSKPVGVPTFLVIDEYPAVIAEKPAVQKYVAKLLREGAKYKIFLCIASQDFQVKTVSPQAGGAIRDNYKTVLYVGGDKTTANVLLDTSVSPETETMLGKGPVMLRCEAVKKAALAYTAFTDNASLYLLLGPSTYQPSDQLHLQDDDPLAENFINADTDLGGEDDLPTLKSTPQTEGLTIAPVMIEKGPKAADIDINILCACWNGGANSVSKLEALFKMSHGKAYKAYKRIKAHTQEPVEEQE